MKRKTLLLLILTLLLGSFLGCANEQDAIYSRVMEETLSPSVHESKTSENKTQESSGSAVSSMSETGQEGQQCDPTFNYLPKRRQGSELFDIEPNTEFSGTLTISVSISSEALTYWIEAFEAAYPNVDIVLKSGFDSMAAAARAEEAVGGLGAVEDQMIVDLFAGEAGDIVDLNAAPYQRYAKSGLFRNLYEFMDNDPDFCKEDYYSNIFEGWETSDGKLPVIGPSVYPSSLAFNKLVLDEMGIDLKKEYPNGLNYQDITKLFYDAVSSGALTENAVLGKFLNPLSFGPFETLNYFDERKSEARFDDPGYVKYLETMKNIPMSDDFNMYVASFEPFKDRSELLQVNSIMFETLDELIGKGNGSNKVYQSYRLQDAGVMFRGVQIYGITSSCENPELAWEFLKFMVSGKDFPEKLNLCGLFDKVYRDQYFYYLPIHRGNLKKLCDSYFRDGEVFQAADNIMETLRIQEFREGELLVSLADIYMDYYKQDLIDAQECAKQLQERTWLYLNE